MTDPAATGVDASRSSSYLAHSRDGRGNGGYYLLGLLVILLVWIVGASLAAAGLAELLGGTADAALSGTGSGLREVWQSLIVQLGPFIVVLAGVLLTVRWVLGRPARTVVTGRPRVGLRRILVGAAVWFVLMAIAAGVEALLHPESVTFTFDARAFVPAAIVVLCLVPVQAATEEVLFRGYVVQWLSLGTDRPGRGLARWPRLIVLAGVSGLVFALPHLANPEAEGAWPFALMAWFTLGAGWAVASVLDGRIELAIGAHVANNVFSIIIVSNSVSAVATASIWTSSRFDWPYLVVATALAAIAFVAVTCRGLRLPAGTS